MTISKRHSVYLLTAAILITGVAIGAQSPNSGQALDGAWTVAVAFDRAGLPLCAPAPSLAIATTANRGTVIADSCFASEGAGYGVWERTGNNEFAITFKGNSFGPDGTVATSYKVRARVSLDASTKAFSGPFQTQIFDLSGNVLDTLTGRVNAVRITSEP
jgi:hypothetical protein